MILMDKMRGALGAKQASLPADVREAVDAWLALPAVDESKAHFFVRHVSLDVATGGLRPGVDALKGIAAVGVQQGAVCGEDVFVCDLSPTGNEETSRQLAALLHFIGKAPLVTYHAAFVDAFLRRAFSEHLGLDFAPHWIDLAWVLPEFFGSQAGGGRAMLDDWLERFGIDLPGRREALPDALAVARLLLAAQSEAVQRGIDCPKKLREIESHRRWLGREG